MQVLLIITTVAGCAFLLWFFFCLERECRALRSHSENIESVATGGRLIVMPEAPQHHYARLGGHRG